MKIANNITQIVGNTPLIRLNKLSEQSGATILAKCEFMNPTSSVKDRIGVSMIEQGIADGVIDENSTIIEPTSGNTGIALAANCAALGIKLILTMPESMSIERRKLLAHCGAQLVLTSAKLGMQGAIDKANELEKQIEGGVVLHQFANKANPQVHYDTTAREILDATDGCVDLFVTSIGTGGTFTGTARRLREELPDIVLYAVEPKQSAVLSNKPAGAHKIQGIGAGFIPEIVDMNLIDGVVQVDQDDAIAMAKDLAQTEGLLVGISSGANVHAALQLAQQKEYKNKTIVTVLCDTAERYMSTELFDA